MEDDLNFWEMEDDLNFWEMEDNLNFWEMGDDLNFWKMEDNPKQLKVKAMVVAPLRVTLFLIKIHDIAWKTCPEQKHSNSKVLK